MEKGPKCGEGMFIIAKDLKAGKALYKCQDCGHKEWKESLEAGY